MKRSQKRNIHRRIMGVTMPITSKRLKWRRNWPCMCGSDKKYKNCCQSTMDKMTQEDGNMVVESLPPEMQAIVDKLKEEEVENKDG